MGIIRAYGDESGDTADPNSPGFAMGAVIGRIQDWRHFKPLWDAMLAKHEIPELHMKRVLGAKHEKNESVFAKFADPAKLDALLMDAVQCILDSRLFCCAHTVFSEDLKIVLERHKLEADPYSFALYHTVIALGTWTLNTYPYFPAFHLVMDRMTKGETRVAAARQLYETDTFSSWRGWPAITVLNPKGEQGSSNMIELQAADMVAWAIRRHLLYIEPWLREHKPTDRPVTWIKPLLDWLQNRLAEDRETYPEAVTFFKTWARLNDNRKLKSFLYNEAMLENHIIKGRKGRCHPIVIAKTTQMAGFCPLTP